MSSEVLTRRLRQVMPHLTRRELDVCVGIMQGKSSEAIALALGISVNTVLTYRKRAYARLGISSHNELMRLVLFRFCCIARLEAGCQDRPGLTWSSNE